MNRAIQTFNGIPIVDKENLLEENLSAPLEIFDGLEKHRAALRMICAGNSFFTASNFYGIRLDELKEFHRQIQIMAAKEVDMKNSPYTMKQLWEMKEPQIGLVKYLARSRGEAATAKFLRRFFLLSKAKTSVAIARTKEKVLLSREQFPGYFGFKAINRANGQLREIYVALGEGDPQDKEFQFEQRCRTYNEFIDVLDGMTGLHIDEIIGFMGKIRDSDLNQKTSGRTESQTTDNLPIQAAVNQEEKKPGFRF